MKYVTLLAGCFIFLSASSVQSIAQQRMIPETKRLDSGIAQPIKVTAITLNTGRWLTQPLVQVENTSANAIQYLVIEIGLPSPKPTGNGPFMLAYGQTLGGKPLSNKVDALQPGMKISLSVSRNACDTVKSDLLASGIRPRPGSHVSTRINAVVFTNGTAWFDGLLHVADPNNPLRWNVVDKHSDHVDLSSAIPLLKFMQASYTVSYNPTPRPAPCWKRLGTQWVDCCGLQIASAIMVQVWGGLFEPLPMSNDCGDGTSCEWIKQVSCSSDPRGETD